MGLKLHAAYIDAGLSAPSLRHRSLMAAGANAGELVHLVTEFIATLLPEMERLGIADAQEVGIKTLAKRIFDEVVARDAVLVARAEVGAWSRTQAR